MTPILQSILVTTDLTHRCDARVASAAALAGATGARLHALHVPHETPRSAGEERSERRLARQLARVVPPGVRVASQRVMTCAPDRALAAAAARTGAELIVLGPAPAVAWADQLFGGGLPVLVVREPLAVPMRRVAVAMRTGEPRGGALEWALRWGAALGPPRFLQIPVELCVAHVLPPGNRAAAIARHGAAPLTEAEESVRVTEEIRWDGRPCDEITSMLERERPDLLVMDLHTREALTRSGWMQLARASSVPVLVVPGRAPATAGAAPRRTLLATEAA
jgi:nucleotide-binding universal stress UspA family protein